MINSRRVDSLSPQRFLLQQTHHINNNDGNQIKNNPTSPKIVNKPQNLLCVNVASPKASSIRRYSYDKDFSKTFQNQDSNNDNRLLLNSRQSSQNPNNKRNSNNNNSNNVIWITRKTLKASFSDRQAPTLENIVYDQLKREKKCYMSS